MLDNKVTVTYQDKRASDIVTLIAKSHGLTPNVQQTAAHITGSFYEILNAVHAQQRSEWDLLVMLAKKEGFDVWVSGHTLNFQPPLALTADPYVLMWSDFGQGNRVSNMLDLKLKRSETIARGIIVNVQSWNQAQGRVFKASVPPKPKSGKVSPLVYNFTPPNLNQQQVNAFANAKLHEVTRHEMGITVALPADNLLSVRGLVRLVGTGTAFDQIYYPISITRHISKENGYKMEFEAKNQSVQTMNALASEQQ